jgi:signal transduction histidine kinase
MLLPIAALCWLGVRTLGQERELERGRAMERLTVAADRVALDIERELQRVEAELTEGRGLRLHHDGVLAAEGTPILFQPEVPAAFEALSSDLLAAARLEFQSPSPAAAIAAYTQIARARSGAAKGEALVALGGMHRRARKLEAALRVYDELETLGPLRVAGGQPAALVALQGAGKALEEAGDAARLRDIAARLSRALGAGGWAIDITTFDIYRELSERWGGPMLDPDAVQRAHHAAELWRIWRRGELPPRGRRFVDASGTVALAVWTSDAVGPVAALKTASELEAQWHPLWDKQRLHAALSHVDGRRIFGASLEGAAMLSPAQTGLPFILTVAAGPGFATGGDALRRNMVIGGVLFAVVLMMAGSYGLYRVTAREVMLARQQSDFVAAVSHEFRTPLTSMRHLIDLLATRGITNEARKAHYYGLLAGETERLQRMVETLLSFGRIDAGAQVWRLDAQSVESLVGSVVEEFRREQDAHPLQVEVEPDLPPIQADREAIGRALWNLLENAAKYSPPGSPIRVFASRSDVASGGSTAGALPKPVSRRRGGMILIGVQDRGIGIPAAEQGRVFQKFVRGNEAKRLGVRGVGVGLALVKRIADAHGGSVTLASDVGRGSPFPLALPSAAPADDGGVTPLPDHERKPEAGRYRDSEAAG